MKYFIVFTLVAFLLHAPFVLVSNNKTQAEWEENREIITVRVEGGDTIDGYWAEYAPNWMSREQYRAEIMELNGMNSYSLRIGQTLKLYVEG